MRHADRQIALISPRQRQYLALAAEGWAKVDIAEQLGVSINTVQATKAIIYHKLKVFNLSHPGQRAVALYAMAFPELVPDEVLYVNSEREKRVIELLAKGQGYDEIEPHFGAGKGVIKNLMTRVWAPLREAGFTAPMYRAIMLSVAGKVTASEEESYSHA